jgi:hypothetical protein
MCYESTEVAKRGRLSDRFYTLDVTGSNPVPPTSLRSQRSGERRLSRRRPASAGGGGLPNPARYETTAWHASCSSLAAQRRASDFALAGYVATRRLSRRRPASAGGGGLPKPARATRLRIGMPAVLHSQRSGERPTSPWRATSRREGCPAVDPRQRAEADESRAGRGSSF